MKLSNFFKFFLPDDNDDMLISQVSENFEKTDNLIYEIQNNKANLTYCTCDTTVSTAEKIAEIAAGTFELKEGAAVEVKFKYTNTTTAPTLNVNDTGAKPIKVYGTTAPDIRMWQANAVVRFTYDGENWLMLNGTKASTSYYGVTKLSSSVSSTSTSEAATPSAVNSAYVLADNAIPKTQRGAVNGVASLDADGKVPLEQIPEGVSILPRLEVMAASGTTVTVTNGETTLSKTSIMAADFDLPCLGDWTITAGSYENTLTVDAVKVYKIQALSLSEATWWQIAQISESGIAPDTWSIGDEKDIVVGSETLTLQIYDFDHDNITGGSKAGITFGLKNLMAETRKMNSTPTNVGGFSGSEMYTWLQGDLLSSLPEDLQEVVKFVDKRTSAGSESKIINTDSMKIFLFSEVELFGYVNMSPTGEGTQYPIFTNDISRIKCLENGVGSNTKWIQRSPCGHSTSTFCAVAQGGNYTTDCYGSSPSGVCFGFCV